MALFARTPLRRLFVPGLAFLSLLAACANVQTPGGGPRDTQAPKVTREDPKNLTKNFSGKTIEIQFDEFIKLNNEYKEVSISPAMVRLPLIRARKNIIEIKFLDSLEKNTTYTINFGKAIVDYNAGNVLKNYTYVFSTGDVLDSLSISGHVTEALTKKAQIDIPVFIIPVRLDSIFGKKSASIFTTTDSAGNFVLRNLKPDTYRIYALKDQGGDRIYNSSNEEIGFVGSPISLNQSVFGIDIETFREQPATLITEDRRIENDGRLFFKFNQQLTAPSLRIIDPSDLDTKKNVEFSAKGDTALLWLPEISFDSIKVAFQNKGIDLDTVTLRRTRRETYNRAVSIRDNAGSGINSLNNLILTFSSPIDSYDLTKIELLEDTTHVKAFQLTKDTESQRKYKLTYPWKIGHTYTTKFAENAFSGPFGSSKYFTNRFRAIDNDIYGIITLDIKTPDNANYIIQLIKDDKDIIKTSLVSTASKIEYHDIPTGTYRIRVVYDENKNGVWDTGNVRQNRQPERIWNRPNTILLKSNFEQVIRLEIP